jgi:hypothetical protein
MFLVLGIFGKFWAVFMAQINKAANFFWSKDPIAILQLQYDQQVDKLKEGERGWPSIVPSWSGSTDRSPPTSRVSPTRAAR